VSTELRAEHAKRLMSDPLFKESFDHLKKQLTLEWGNTDQTDIDTRESLYLAIHLVDRLKTHFTNYLESDEIAKLQQKFPHI